MKQLIALLSVFVLAGAVLIGGCGQVGNVTAPPFAIDVRLYGANPNDTVSDSAAIQAAIDAAGNFAKIVFPPQRPGSRGYILSTPIVSLRDGQVWEAEGARFSVAFNGSAIQFGKVSTISNVTNADPMVITTDSAHYLQTGDGVVIRGVNGTLSANSDAAGGGGNFSHTDIVTVLSPTTFSIARAGNGAYSSGTDYVLKVVHNQKINLGNITYYNASLGNPDPYDPTLAPYPVNNSNPGASDAGWTAGNYGVEIVNTHSGEYHIMSVAGFNRGVYLHAFATDSHHGRLEIRRARSNLNGLYIYADGFNGKASDNSSIDYAGSLNTWTHDGGRIGWVDSDPNAAGGYAIYASRSTSLLSRPLYDHHFRGYYFETPAVTAGNPAGYILCNFLGSDWQCGWEPVPGSGTTVLYVDARKSVIDPGDTNGVYDFSDNGGNAFFVGNKNVDETFISVDAASQRAVKLYGKTEMLIEGGDATYPTLGLRNVNNSTNKTLSIRRDNAVEQAWWNGVGVIKLGSQPNSLLSADQSDGTFVAGRGQIVWNSDFATFMVSDGVRYNYALPGQWSDADTATSASAGSDGAITISTNAIGSIQIPANVMIRSRCARITLWGYFHSANATTPTVDIKLKAGSTTLASTGAITVDSDDVNFGWKLEALVTSYTAVGASAGWNALGNVTIFADNAGLVPTSSGNQVFQLKPPTYGTLVTIDSTAAQTMSATANWSASTGNAWTTNQGTLEIIR